MHDQGIHYVYGRQPNGIKWCKHEPTHLQGSVLKFEGVSRSLSVRRSHQLCAVAWNSLLYWRKLDQRVNVVQSHAVIVVHLSYLLDMFLFTSCIYAWFGFVLCIILFSLVSVPLTWVDSLSYLDAVTSINFLARSFFVHVQLLLCLVFQVNLLTRVGSGQWMTDLFINSSCSSYYLLLLGLKEYFRLFNGIPYISCKNSNFVYLLK